MAVFQKIRCVICNEKIRVKEEPKKTCSRFCNFVHTTFVYCIPGGGVELSKDMEHIKKKYQEKLEQEKARRFSTENKFH